jgi:hypothetical protein
VRTSVRWIVAAVLCTALIAGLMPPAEAYFPTGGFDQFGLLRYAKWPLYEFDSNNDGQVTDGEGLEMFYEGGRSGFNAEEILLLDEAFQVWQDVPTSYASFHRKGIIYDPLPVGLDSLDFRTTVLMQVTEEAAVGGNVADPAEVIIPDVGFPVLGLTITLYTIEDTVLQVGTEGNIISAGTIVDSDIIIDAASHRVLPGQTAPLADLKATMVHEIGGFLGLGHTPLNNLRELADPFTGDTLGLVENPVFWLSGADGLARSIGVTPTMFPVYFYVDQGNDTLGPGWADLAPDDISGVSFLYPRGSQANFFNIKQEARSHTRPGTGLPSFPLPGAHVVAWADVDGNPETRVPLFSTMTGLYERFINEQLQGRFDLRGLWKQVEVPGSQGALFNPTYVLTLNPLNGTGFDRQAPPLALPEVFDSIQGPSSYSAATRSVYLTAFSSEVFHEIENVIDISQKDAGTRLIWDFGRNTVVSQLTGKTIPAMLPNNRPMFGDANDVCPMNIIGPEGTEEVATAGLYPSSGPKSFGMNDLRLFRDGVLLETVVGTALVDTYYQLSPTLARFLIRNDRARGLFRNAVYSLFWTMTHLRVAAGLLAAFVLTLSGCWWLVRRRRGRALAAMLLALAALFFGLPAHAGIAYVTTPQMVLDADAIVTGTVSSTSARWGTDGRIYTDVALTIQDSVKGGLNKSSTVHFSVLGGRIGGLVMDASSLPSFRKDEKVLLYLREDDTSHVLVVYGGIRGKFMVNTDAKTGEEYVLAGSGPADLALEEDAKALGSEDSSEDKITEAMSGDGRIALSEYLKYLRGLVRAQE